MGARMASLALVFAISIVFCTCCPIITFFGGVYVLLSLAATKYLLVFAETRKSDLGGDHWVLGLKHVWVALGIFVTLMIGILRDRAPSWYPVAAVSPLLVVLALRLQEFDDLVWKDLPFEEIASVDDAGGKSEMCGVYVQAECLQQE